MDNLPITFCPAPGPVAVAMFAWGVVFTFVGAVCFVYHAFNDSGGKEYKSGTSRLIHMWRFAAFMAAGTILMVLSASSLP